MNHIGELTVDTISKTITRPVRREDYEQIRCLLLQTQAIAPMGFNWDIRRWEGRCWYDKNETGDPDWHKNSQLWQTADNHLIGLVHPDGPGFTNIQIHPDYRHLEAEMIDWAENHLTAAKADGTGRQLQFFVYEYDVQRQQLLAERGYQKTSYGGVIRNMRLRQRPLPNPQLAPGYSLRSTEPENGRDAQQIADLLNAAFQRTFHNALEYQQFTRHAACFHRELDLVAVAEDGRIAAYVGIPYDEFNQRGIFEPVCTHPDHQQKGLAKALMQEGLHRLKARGAIDVVVDTGDMIPANRLYTSMGFTEIYKGYDWLYEIV